MRSTIKNLLLFDAAVASIISWNHAYDIISVDFKKTFDKAPHHHVLRALSDVGICGAAYDWFVSFQSKRTQQVRVGNQLSASCNVTSGIVQGSCLDPVLYTILTDSLLQLLAFPSNVFATDIKFMAHVIVRTQHKVQTEEDKIENWSFEHDMPLSLEKTFHLHIGCPKPLHSYAIRGSVIIR